MTELAVSNVVHYYSIVGRLILLTPCPCKMFSEYIVNLLYIFHKNVIAELVVYGVDSENSVGNLSAPPKTGLFQEPLIQVDPEQSTENPVSDPSFSISTPKTVQVLGYPLSQLPDGKKQQHEPQLIQGGMQYVPQYQYPGPVPISPYYPMYQIPVHPQHISGPPNQPYPVYLVPMRSTQYNDMSMPSNTYEANTTASSRPPLIPQSAAITQPVTHKEVFGAQTAESAKNVYSGFPASTQLVGIPSSKGQLVMGPTETQIALEQITTASVLSAIQDDEFDEDVAYNQIYKTQPLPPVLPSQYQAMTKGTPILSEP